MGEDAPGSPLSWAEETNVFNSISLGNIAHTPRAPERQAHLGISWGIILHKFATFTFHFIWRELLALILWLLSVPIVAVFAFPVAEWQTHCSLPFCILKDMGLPLDGKQLRPQFLWEYNSLSSLSGFLAYLALQIRRNVYMRAQEHPESCQLGQFCSWLLVYNNNSWGMYIEGPTTSMVGHVF